VQFFPETLQSPTEPANRNERQGHAKNSPYWAKHREGEYDGGRSKEGRGDDEGEQRAVTRSPWRFRGIASGTVVIEQPGKAAPARAAPGTDCATQESALAAQCLRSTSHCTPAESTSPTANAGAASLTKRANSLQIANITIS
jgi:hypothetical protein